MSENMAPPPTTAVSNPPLQPMPANLGAGDVIRASAMPNLPPPTQGLASLLILGIFERLGEARLDSFEHHHGLIEATKRAL